MGTVHALIVGPRGVGKSTLIRRVLAELGRPVSGFTTKKEDALPSGGRGSPVYLYTEGEERRQTPENLIGYGGGRGFQAYREAFDRYAPRLRKAVPPGHIVLMDELGFMESSSAAFCSAVLRLLDGDAPVIAAVKDRDTPFLEAVRAHPNCKCFFITPENRDALFPKVLKHMGAQLGGAQGG